MEVFIPTLLLSSLSIFFAPLSILLTPLSVLHHHHFHDVHEALVSVVLGLGLRAMSERSLAFDTSGCATLPLPVVGLDGDSGDDDGHGERIVEVDTPCRSSNDSVGETVVGANRSVVWSSDNARGVKSSASSSSAPLSSVALFIALSAISTDFSTYPKSALSFTNYRICFPWQTFGGMHRSPVGIFSDAAL